MPIDEASGPASDEESQILREYFDSKCEMRLPNNSCNIGWDKQGTAYNILIVVDRGLTIDLRSRLCGLA